MLTVKVVKLGICLKYSWYLYTFSMILTTFIKYAFMKSFMFLLFLFLLQTLSLTCTVCGDPKPQVSWSKNDQEVEPSDQYVIALDSGKFASLTIKGVSMEDSGKYTMTVQNRFGGETVDIIVSVYKHGDKIPDIKPTPSSKRILPPTGPIIIPTTKAATPAPAPAGAKSPAPPQSNKSSAPPRGMKSPTPTRKK